VSVKPDLGLAGVFCVGERVWVTAPPRAEGRVQRCQMLFCTVELRGDTSEVGHARYLIMSDAQATRAEAKDGLAYVMSRTARLVAGWFRFFR
jgi:hypothetical protein